MPTIQKRVKVNITEEDIRHGKVSDCFACPGALALKRHIKDNYTVIVGSVKIQISNDASVTMQEMDTPLELSGFIIRFDTEQLVHPTSFDLYINEELLIETSI